MENDANKKRLESVYSTKVRAGRRRTYFFDVRKTKGDDFYITLTESTKRFNGEGYDRHKIFLYKEDFNRFLANLEDVINHVKTELMPDYDYEEYEKRQAEWEARRAEEEANKETAEESGSEAETKAEDAPAEDTGEGEAETSEADASESDTAEIDTEEDMSW